MSPTYPTCPVCGNGSFFQKAILWPELIERWELTPYERAYIDRQQGIHCGNCGCNLRTMALGQALKGPLLGARETALSLADVLRTTLVGSRDILEVNEAGALAPLLSRLPRHARASWPEVDLRALPYEDGSFDIVVHSDTLEHVGNGRPPPQVYAFDFFGTLDSHEDVRALARRLHDAGNEIHIVSAISPGLPGDNNEVYAAALRALDVPYTRIHRVDHDPKLKVEVLKRIGAAGFWDDVMANVVAARKAGVPSCLVGMDEPLQGILWENGFALAIRECYRVLRPGGALCFTVPVLYGKLTRSTEGRPPTYHDPSPTPSASLRVHTEFGADVWALVLAAGFRRCEFVCIEWPAGLAITAWK